MPPSPERKLAAILSADVVGYSRLMAENEDETVRRIGAYRTEVTNLVDEHRGRVVDFTGDNFLAEFPTATDAVEAAAEVQRVIGARNAGVAPGRAMEFRMGIHLGEVRVEGERIYGDGVNIAARLEGLAEPGGICVSSEVHGQVARKLSLGFEDLGEQTVKNIPDPVRAYRLNERSAETQGKPRRLGRWVAAAGVLAAGLVALLVSWPPPKPPAPGAVAEEAPEVAPLTSIAVLPFDDMSPDGDQKWLADGIAEDLIEALSRTEALRVIARTSAFALKGREISAIGERLGVGAVVEGSVRRSGSQLQVTAQLIRVSDASHLWSARYDRQTDDVFAVQREIARSVAEAVRNELGLRDTFSYMIESRYSTPDVRAWELVKKANEAHLAYTEAAFRSQIDLCQQALEIDPDYAQAHMLLGWGFVWLWSQGYDRSEDMLMKAKAGAERALELEPTNAGAHNLLGWVSMREGDWEGAEARYAAALKATPSQGVLREAYGLLLLATGRIREAARHLQKAVALDPEAPTFRNSLGQLRTVEGDYEAAIREFDRARSWPFALGGLSYAHHLNGDDERAAEALIQGAPSGEVEAEWRAAFDRGGIVGVARARLEYQISESATACTRDPGDASYGFAVVGDADRMLECLDEGVRVKSPAFLVKVHPAFDPYRDDPRFAALLERMNLAE